MMSVIPAHFDGTEMFNDDLFLHNLLVVVVVIVLIVVVVVVVRICVVVETVCAS